MFEYGKHAEGHLLDWCACVCNYVTSFKNVDDFKIRNILLLKCVDTSVSASKCSGYGFQQAED